jgi:hypothetical protein
MTNQKRQLLENCDGKAAYWEYRFNPAEYERTQPHQQANQNTDDTWIRLLCIIFTIGFLVLLAKMTICSIL